MLELTIAVELFLGRYIEAYLIAALLTLNAVISQAQEAKAGGAVVLLRKRLAVNARVSRGGEWTVLPARELVPGDLIRVRAGDVVPADARVVEGRAEADQSSLTGESQAVERGAGDVLYSGSVVVRGEATAEVTATGARTFFGRTAELVQIAQPKLHIEGMIAGIVRWLVVLVVVALAFGVGVTVVTGSNLGDITPLALVLLVSAVPVALPALFTISTALGSLELSKRGAVVTRLDAVEDAATMDILCSDKTGTITENRLTLVEATPLTPHLAEEVALYGALASREENWDPIDAAFIEAAKRVGQPTDDYGQTSFSPFDPSTRMTEATLDHHGRHLYAAKGAIESILRLCHTGGAEAGEVRRRTKELSSRGYRVLAVATGPRREEAYIVGLAALFDPPRGDAPHLIEELRSLGISVKMLTGDALPIAQEVAAKAGIGDRIIRISDLKAMSERERLRAAEESDGFAEVYPEDKYTIVRTLQAGGHVVGMTGDGVNDAPALRQAEVGIAVSNATDVAKRAASVVLVDEGFSGIVETIVAGRGVYQRITTWTLNKVAKTFEWVLFVVLGMALTGGLVVSSLHMIILLLITDYVTLAISTDSVRPSPRPERWREAPLVRLGVFYGSLVVAESLALLYAGENLLGLSGGRLQTLVFVWLALSGYFTILSVRERRRFWESRPSGWVALAMGFNSVLVYFLSMAGVLGIEPLEPWMFLAVLLYALVSCLIVNDPVKERLASGLSLWEDDTA